jgi:hypothetical protein
MNQENDSKDTGNDSRILAFCGGPPVLNSSRNRVDGLSFLGLSLSRFTEGVGNINSESRQTSFDFNALLDRQYRHVASTNDDGWLVGGGEDDSLKLPNLDSAHCEIMRIGNFDESLGGLSMEKIQRMMMDGSILIPEVRVVPTRVVPNGNSPPEVEVRFDMKIDKSTSCDLWSNWQLKFIHNQLFEKLHFPSRFCPGPFHMTIARKVLSIIFTSYFLTVSFFVAFLITSPKIS